MSKSTAAYVLVVEDPDGQPEVYSHGDVAILQTSLYPLAIRWCPDPLAEGYEVDHYATLASTFPPGSEPHQALMGLQRQFTRHLKSLNLPNANDPEIAEPTASV